MMNRRTAADTDSAITVREASTAVVRPRTVRGRSPGRRRASSGPIGPESVTASRDSLDTRTAERAVDLPAERTDVYLHDVRTASIRTVADSVEDGRLVDGGVRALGQTGEYRELAAGQRHFDAATTAAPGRAVYLQITEVLDSPSLGPGAPQQREQSCPQHHEGERLDQVVVRSGLQTLGLVVVAVLRRQRGLSGAAGCVSTEVLGKEAVQQRAEAGLFLGRQSVEQGVSTEPTAWSISRSN